MKKLIKGIVVVALAAVMLCITNVMAGKVGFSTTLSSDKKKLITSILPMEEHFKLFI